MANEHAGIAEEEYRKKSTALKEAQKEIATLKAQLAKSTTSALPARDTAKEKLGKVKETTQPFKKVRWGFEPEDNSSQPFWDHSNEYSRYIADMVAATVSALPNIPMQTAISTAIDTVRVAGPAILSQPVPKPATDIKQTPSGRSSPGPSSNASFDGPKPPSPSAAAQRRSRAPSPSATRPAPSTLNAKPVGAMTFAQMAATVLDPPAAHRFLTSYHHHLWWPLHISTLPPLPLPSAIAFCVSTLLLCRARWAPRQAALHANGAQPPPPPPTHLHEHFQS